MAKELDSEHQRFLTLPPKEKINFVQEMVDSIIVSMSQKQANVDQFIEKVDVFKSFLSGLYRLSGVYKKEYFDFLTFSIKSMWEAVEKCSSQFLLYPALSAFIDLFSRLKGLNPFYTLHSTIDETIEYGKLPAKDKISDLLQKEKQNLQFLIDYMQLDSVLRLNLDKKSKLEIIKSATNYAQLLVLTLYNFLFTIPVIPKEEFISWSKLFEGAIQKALVGHAHLEEVEDTELGLLRTKTSESSLYSLTAQLYLLNAKYLNENVEEYLNLANVENAHSLQVLEQYIESPQYSSLVQSYYFQQKTLLLETHFYQILHRTVKTQYKHSVYVGDIKDDKAKLTQASIKHEVHEILREIEEYLKILLHLSKRQDIGISYNMINIYTKIAYGAYVYGLANNLQTMEEIIKTSNIDVGDPELSLLLGEYWLCRWTENQIEEYLDTAISYFERASEVYQMLYNNRYVPIYGYSLLALIQVYKGNRSRAEVYLMKADDEFNDAKSLLILNNSEIYYYEQFREQMEDYLNNIDLEKPLRFDKPFNVLDFNTWSRENNDWRKIISHLPEPFPFNLEQLKILEFEFFPPNLNYEKSDN
ncbi:MAG: hypothetical protein KGD64_12815 [Candidatus Heimdallarchaeota archaeon]|nr:hypothetical protein [Candidatus Heimdallarchaeota archaeon]